MVRHTPIDCPVNGSRTIQELLSPTHKTAKQVAAILQAYEDIYYFLSKRASTWKRACEGINLQPLR
jgi:hypothetical protein